MQINKRFYNIYISNNDHNLRQNHQFPDLVHSERQKTELTHSSQLRDRHHASPVWQPNPSSDAQSPLCIPEFKNN